MRNLTTTAGQFVTSNPMVHIAVNRNRIKTYQVDGEVKAYLKDGTEFQLEFYNDSSCKVKAEITINGKEQESALVLEPYQKFNLDRFMDEKKKFKFNTFLTGNDDIEELKKIIEKNGRIEVKFYKEYQPINWISDGTCQDFKWETLCSNDSTLTGGNYSATIKSIASGPQINLNEEVETGRIESGKKSSQEFQSVNLSWEVMPCAEFNYHIMPESYRPKVKKTKKQKNVIAASSIRTYCSECGRRVKKGYNFCPGCGEKF